MWTQDPDHEEWSCNTEYRPSLGFEEGTRQNCVILQLRTHSGMEFANDDDDDIYDSEHRSKLPE